jgi:hypothetical protein
MPHATSRGLLTATAALLLACWSAAANAHHSFAMFDGDKTLTLNGTLYAVEFKNPHGWVWIKTTDSNGSTQLWGLEGGSTNDLARQGYNKTNLVVGTKVVVTYNPLKDGRNGGRLRKLEFPNGSATVKPVKQPQQKFRY